MDDTVHGPAGDVLEELAERGPTSFPSFLARCSSGTEAYRVAVVLGGLILGPEVAEVSREVLRSRDSKEKASFLLGLGELGHPEAEGYFGRQLRENAAPDSQIAALRCLGRIGGKRSLPLLIEALGRDTLFPAACEALAVFGGDGAVKALLGRAGELPAFRALAGLGARAAAPLFVEGLSGDSTRCVEALRGIGVLRDPNLASAVVPFVRSGDEAVGRAAFEAYARLGAPLGPGPLLEVASGGVQAWMIQALAGVPRAEVHRFVVRCLAPPQPNGFWRRLFGRARAEPLADPMHLCAALREADDPAVLRGLSARLREERDPGVLRELLSNFALLLEPGGRDEVRRFWREGTLPERYLAAAALLKHPSEDFLAEALEFIGRPGFCELDAAGGLADPARLLEAHARDNNPFLLFGGFLDSGLIGVTGLLEALVKRFRAWDFPPAVAAGEGFREPEDGDVGSYLDALAAAQPAAREAVTRLWPLLAGVGDRGAPVLELFLSWAGAHRGGVQRMLARMLPAAVDLYLEGKDDRSLPELEQVASRLVPTSSCYGRLKRSFEAARGTLRSRCRDMVLMSGGVPRGDMVLIEKL